MIYADEAKYSIDFLLANLDEVHLRIEKECKEGITEEFVYMSLYKLIDHINLERMRYLAQHVDQQVISQIREENEKLWNKLYSTEKMLEEAKVSINSYKQELSEKEAQFETATKRLNELSNQVNKTKRQLDDSKKQMGNVKKDLDSAKKSMENAEKKLVSSQADVVAILGIFASIVFAFTGSISLLGEALNGMLHAPFFKATYFILLCALVVFNTISGVLYMSSKIIGKNIHNRPEIVHKPYEKPQGKNEVISKLRHFIKYPFYKCRYWLREIFEHRSYIFWVNFVILALLAVLLLLWHLDARFYFVVWFA